MPRVIRTATIQARVLPTIKEASELVLWRIGLNMSEAIELFLRRVITDERLPFDVVAVDSGRLDVHAIRSMSARKRGAKPIESTHGNAPSLRKN